MNAIETFAPDRDSALVEAFAAELTESVFPVALRYGVGDGWLDLELDLWHKLAETLARWGRPAPRVDSPGESERPREGLLAALAGAAYDATLRHGARRSVPQSEPRLYLAFRSAVSATVKSCRRALA